MIKRPRLAVVPGEPAGIGPELCIQLAHRAHDCELFVFADPAHLLRTAKHIGVSLRIKAPGEHCQTGELIVSPIALPSPVQFGQINPCNSATVIHALKAASDACLRGELDGMITGPTHKAAINAAGIVYSGTTEYLAEQANTDVVMMLANSHMRVALATTHLPLRAVPDAIQFDSLQQTLRILQTALQTQFGMAKPRIAVLGLNPHAGEQGILGSEEISIIIPVMDSLRAQGFNLLGPLSADTAFLPNQLEHVDAVVAMYHDQGLPVLKFSGFETAVNITLGLPYPRVAVDHGTALELAGKNCASAESLWQATIHCREFALRKLSA